MESVLIKNKNDRNDINNLWYECLKQLNTLDHNPNKNKTKNKRKDSLNDNSFNEDVNKICLKGSDKLREYYKTGNINLIYGT